MTKLTLSNVQNFQNESTAVTTLTSNNVATITAMENTLSRDGTLPNHMNADLDMNSNRIINLPDATTDQEPATYSQLLEHTQAIEAGAVIEGTYVTLSPEATLTNERVLTAGNHLTLTDGGANSTVTLDVNEASLNSDTATLTNKTIDLSSNTLTGTKAEFNTALSDDDFVTLTGTETLTNKTMSGAANTFTNIPVSTAISGLGAGVSTFLSTPSSNNLAAAVTGETGTGALVFGTEPTFTSTTTVAGTPGNATFSIISGDNNTAKILSWRTANSRRWSMRVDDNEAGTNSGSNWSLRRYDDTGTFIDAPISAVRSTGAVTIAGLNATSPTFVTPALGTPTSVNLTNATNLPVSTGISGLGTGVSTFLQTPSSANLRTALTDETGTGAAVFGTSPTITTSLGVSGTETITSNSATALVVGPNGTTNPTFQVDCATASAATGLKVTSFPAGSGMGIASISSGTNENISVNAKGSGITAIGNASTGNVSLGAGGGGVTVGSAMTYGGVTLSNAVTGTGNMVLSTSPTLTTPTLGAATATTINGVTLNNNAWSTYTPTVTSGGSITSYTSSGRYKQIGKTVHLEITVTITNAGTGSGQLICTLPVNAFSGVSYIGLGKESFNSGKSGAAQILTTDNTRVQAIDSNGTTFIATNGIINIGITYEAA